MNLREVGDLKLRLLAREVMAMGLGLAPDAAFSVTRAAVHRLEADARAGRPLIPLRVAVTDELWRRRAVCAADVADTLQVGNGLSEFTARLRVVYHQVCGYTPSEAAMRRIVRILMEQGIILTSRPGAAAGSGRGGGSWAISPAARRVAREVAPASEVPRVDTGGEVVVPPVAGTALPLGARAAATPTRRALVEADLLAHPDDTVAARARRLGAQMGLKDRAARGQISAVVSALRTAS
ncbi:hypothetical protein [Streptomyces mirabilis]